MQVWNNSWGIAIYALNMLVVESKNLHACLYIYVDIYLDSKEPSFSLRPASKLVSFTSLAVNWNCQHIKTHKEND